MKKPQPKGSSFDNRFLVMFRGRVKLFEELQNERVDMGISLTPLITVEALKGP
jgi:hypothetical protein